jgi:hypothetical protein
MICKSSQASHPAVSAFYFSDESHPTRSANRIHFPGGLVAITSPCTQSAPSRAGEFICSIESAGPDIGLEGLGCFFIINWPQPIVVRRLCLRDVLEKDVNADSKAIFVPHSLYRRFKCSDSALPTKF